MAKNKDRPDPQESKDIARTSKQKIVSWAVFVFSLLIVLISLTTVFFPALIARSTSLGTFSNINLYETGVLATPLLVTNFVLLGIGILYHKSKLPAKIQNSIRFIFHFEVSKKVAIITVIVLIGIFVAVSADKLAKEETWNDYTDIKPRVKDWTINVALAGYDTQVTKFFLLSTSLKIFGNIRVIPFLASITLLILTYYITKEISHKRFAGLVAMTILLQSNIFLSYGASATYDYFWIVLYLFSLYVMYKRWYLTHVSYVLSMLGKPLTAVFLPMTLFFLYRAEIPRKEKIRILIPYGVITIVLIVVGSVEGEKIAQGPIGFDGSAFWSGFTSWAFQLRFDYLVILFLLPVIVGLFISSKRGMLQSEYVMILIAGVLVIAPFLAGLTTLTNQPYRFVSLVVFFAMGVGTIFSVRRPENNPSDS